MKKGKLLKSPIKHSFARKRNSIEDEVIVWRIKEALRDELGKLAKIQDRAQANQLGTVVRQRIIAAECLSEIGCGPGNPHHTVFLNYLLENEIVRKAELKIKAISEKWARANSDGLVDYIIKN